MQLTPDLLLKAYAIGIFPMAESRADPELHWIDPEERGVLPLDGFHLPRRLKRTLRQRRYEVSCDRSFDQVIRACAARTDNRPDTWINPVIERLVNDLYRMGFAHCIEVRRDDRLVGGLYGIALGACFFGESMFSRERDASKIALSHLVLRLKKGGFRLLDTQFNTDHLSQFGVVEIPRERYRDLLGRSVNLPAEFPRGPVSDAELEDFLDNAG